MDDTLPPPARSPDQADDRAPTHLISGIDTLEVSYFVDTYFSRLDFEELRLQQDTVRQSRVDQFKKIVLGSETFALRAAGAYPYAYVLSNRAFTVKRSTGSPTAVSIRKKTPLIELFVIKFP